MSKLHTKGDVSIVISHYNKARFLDQAITSAMHQSVPPKEIIVVDDCSEPTQLSTAGRICRKHRIKLIERQFNGGPSAARNTGILASSCDWIQILDADDWLPPTSLEARLSASDKKASVLWIAGQMAKTFWLVPQTLLRTSFFKHLRPIFFKRAPVLEPSLVPSDDPFKVRWHHGAILYHRTLFHRFGLYDESLRGNEDKELRWRFWYFTQTYPLVTDDIVYIYRQGYRGRLTGKDGPLRGPKGRLSRDKLLQQIEIKKLNGLDPTNTKFL